MVRRSDKSNEFISTGNFFLFNFLVNLKRIAIPTDNDAVKTKHSPVDFPDGSTCDK